MGYKATPDETETQLSRIAVLSRSRVGTTRTINVVLTQDLRIERRSVALVAPVWRTFCPILSERVRSKDRAVGSVLTIVRTRMLGTSSSMVITILTKKIRNDEAKSGSGRHPVRIMIGSNGAHCQI